MQDSVDYDANMPLGSPKKLEGNSQNMQVNKKKIPDYISYNRVTT